MRLAEAAVWGLFGLWAALSLLVYVPRLQRVIRSRDLFVMIPEWRFFAPIPARHDYVLLYRDLDAAETWSQWHEWVAAAPRHWWNCVWNPAKRANKGLLDLTVELSRRAQDKDPAIELSSAYLALLNAVSSQPRLVTPKRTQFMILMQSAIKADAKPQVLYLSNFHDL
jgi:hypothetical protein